MRKLQQEQNVRHDRFSGWVVFILFFIVALLSAGRVFAANRLVETSDNLRRLDAQVSQLEAQNQTLSQEVRTQESMAAIENRVLAGGFVKTGHFAFLSNSREVAFGISADKNFVQ